MLLKDKKIFAFFARKFYFTSFIVALTIILITLILFFANKSMLYNDIEEKFNVTLKFIQHKRADMFASLEDLKEGILVSKNEYKIKQILDIKIKTNEYFDAIFYVKDDLVIHSELNKFSFPSDFVARDFDNRLDENNFYL